MNKPEAALAELRNEVATCIGLSVRETGLAQLDELLTYLEDSYPDDDVLQALSWRAWTSNVGSSNGDDNEQELLKAERDRVERWVLYLERKGDPSADDVRRLWYGLDCCFNPSSGNLEEWFSGFEGQTLEELIGRHGGAPQGEPPTIFN
ncbi:hypothetical protein D1604_10255 [Brevundimonas sp. LPMIX5]|uniref:hypothetical protein n=1 Tax=Brevundimonas sp. LPMIX5 TaxID=2305887 RepID=UPI000ECE0DEE|nr:hypothetical protein [Brevundimonas sp. LPMIX5]RIJ65904.1 hypothetical protein D1604_10255 [Brevundimonas sp. LPMIX5]